MTLRELRSKFPHTERTIYFNHAATAPLSTPVMDSVSRYLEERHVSRIENFTAFAPVVESARERVGRLLGTTSDRVEFAPNTSYALNVLARGLKWQRGDRIAVPGCEFPSNVYPFLNLERDGVAVDFIPHRDGVVAIEDVEKALTPATRLLTVSWVQFLSGFRIDLRALGTLCRERNVIFCVDAIQGLGALELDVHACGIDFLACGGHKWIMAEQGIGFLYVTEELQERIVPAAGWAHGPIDWDYLSDYRLRFHPDASRFRVGTMNHVGVASLEAALALHEVAGPEWCEQQVVARSSNLGERLDRLGLRRYGTSAPENASGIVTIEHDDVESLHRHLLAHSIEAAVRQRKLRFSPTYYNSEEEIDRVLDVVEAFLKRT